MERVRWRLTNRVPFRCYDCDWRGWSDDSVTRRRVGPSDHGLHREIADDEIDQLDDGAPESLT